MIIQDPVFALLGDVVSPLLLQIIIFHPLLIFCLSRCIDVVYFGHQLLIMPLPRAHHLLRLPLRRLLISLCTCILISQALEARLHGVVLLLGFFKIVVAVKHKQSIIVHSSLAAQWRQRDCRLLAHVTIRLHDFWLVCQFSCQAVVVFAMARWAAAAEHWVWARRRVQILRLGLILASDFFHSLFLWRVYAIFHRRASLPKIRRTRLNRVHSRSVDTFNILGASVWWHVVIQIGILNIQITEIQDGAGIIDVFIGLII